MAVRLIKVSREFNIGVSTIVEFLDKKGHKIDSDPNTKLSDELVDLLEKEFQSEGADKLKKAPANPVKAPVPMEEEEEEESDEDDEDNEEIATPQKTHINVKVIGSIDIDAHKKPKTTKKTSTPSTENSKSEELPEIPTVANTTPIEPEEKPAITEIEITVPTLSETEEITVEQPENTVAEDETIFVANKANIEDNVKVIGKIDLTALNQKTRPDKKSKKEKEQERKERRDKFKPAPVKVEVTERPEKQDHSNRQEQPKKENIYKTQVEELKSPKVIGKVDLSASERSDDGDRKKRKRIHKGKVDISAKNVFDAYDSKNDKGIVSSNGRGNKQQLGKKYAVREEINEEDVDRAIKETRARLDSGGKKSKGSKYRRDKREAIREAAAEEEEMRALEDKILKVTEFVSANDLSIMMNIPATDIIKTCMDVGLFIALNQRLDAETIRLITGEFGFEVEFVTADIQEAIEEVADKEEDLLPRPPIVTVMGHVDHGKTSLLDYVRKTNVIAGEAGGITQHIGAYSVKMANGNRITFLDTPGHEAFTAMRARGAQVTDVVIIVVAADDCVMPQTVEAINHAAAAGVPMIFAINKIDKPGANPEKIKEQLAAMNYLVEDWGGKYQSQEIAAKHGVNVEALMEKVILEAEMLDLKANPNKPALGTVIESQLDKGRGYVSTLLVTAGTLRKGDIILAGKYSGKVKAMFNERNQQITEAGPSTPVTILGLDGAPQAGEKFNVMKSERDAREIANKRDQLHREQELKTMRHITLDEIGRRIAIGNFKELNIIIKGDVDGSIEALADSLIKLSTEEIQINIKHKAVGQISEADVLLASASDAIIIGFQVRPSSAARTLAEREGVDMRLYSIIYAAIDEIKDAMTGMLSPEIKEEITGSCEIREVFKITKVGTVAGCFVTEGKIFRNSKIRIIRDGIVVHSGDLGSLKRFKDDVKEVGRGYECGLNIHNYNDIKVGDIIEAYEEKEVKRKLE
ncbi:MAG: translation initiation factor IF-2 [Bacteroidales bacterium]|jgi:translation initiation factor IF-2|nr:translation initiation factor IF-2 [Bacteroidales bacterium]